MESKLVHDYIQEFDKIYEREERKFLGNGFSALDAKHLAVRATFITVAERMKVVVDMDQIHKVSNKRKLEELEKKNAWQSQRIKDLEAEFVARRQK